MSSGTACSRCGSTRIVPRARVIDRAHYGTDSGNVRLGIPRNPGAWVFKNHEHADIHARVCGDCGLVELFVEDAQSMYQAYLDSL